MNTFNGLPASKNYALISAAQQVQRTAYYNNYPRKEGEYILRNAFESCQLSSDGYHPAWDVIAEKIVNTQQPAIVKNQTGNEYRVWYDIYIADQMVAYYADGNLVLAQ